MRGSWSGPGLTAIVSMVALSLAALAGCQKRGEPEAPKPARLHVRREIQEAVERGDSALGYADTLGARRTWERLAGFYERRRYAPLWSDHNRLRPQAESLMVAIARTPDVGLDPGHYDHESLGRLLVTARRRDPLSAWFRPRALARFDVRATFAYLRLASHLRHGRLPGDTLDGDWVRKDEEGFWSGLLEGIGRDDPAGTLAGLEPPHDAYRRLKSALASYRAVQAAGGWPEIPPGAPIKRGARGARVSALVRRLAATGELAGPVRDTVMDARLQLAVGDFQSRAGIPRSGVVGEVTRAALNVPVERRIREIELNLERWRWLPRELGSHHVEVDIPAYRVEMVRDDRIHVSLRAVVGKPKTPTPVFTDALTYLELNPTWTLPVSVVFDEILPAMKRQDDYLAANHISIVTMDANRDTVQPEQVEWQEVTPDSFPYLLVQAAGPDNPLGQIKLMCPNEYDVYLHDTSQRSKFNEAVRTYSHGCVRVAGATELADSLMGFVPGDTTWLDSLIATGQWRRLRLPAAVPVHFMYWTAWADSAGRVSFREDVYGLDQRLERALADRSVAFELNPGVTISPHWIKAREEARKRAEERLARAEKRRR